LEVTPSRNVTVISF